MPSNPESPFESNGPRQVTQPVQRRIAGQGPADPVPTADSDQVRPTSLRPPSVAIPVRRTDPRSSEHRINRAYSDGLFGGYFFLATMIFSVAVAWFVGPRLVEEYYYAAAIGKARGEYENAVDQLEKAPLTDVSLAYQMVAQRIRPSVVSVKAYKAKDVGFGSGVVLSSDGYIMTNAHVVKGSEDFEIELFDRRRFEAKLVGVDPESDLAVLKIDANSLIPAAWGDSESIEVGSIVWAIGSPYEFTQTVTSGILSGKNRRGDAYHSKQTLLQTDAAVNPGNSGGPLVDIQGHVIGINTSIFGKTFQGISFAVPSSTAKFVFQQMVTKRTVTRGYLGVYPRGIDSSMAERMNLPDLEGASVIQVQTGSPADTAGLRRGDVLRRWNGVPIRDYRQVFRYAESSPVGAAAKVDFWRINEAGVLVEGSTEVVIGELPAMENSIPSKFFRER